MSLMNELKDIMIREMVWKIRDIVAQNLSLDTGRMIECLPKANM